MQFLTEDNGEIKRIGDGELRQFSFLFFSKRFFSFLSEIGAWVLGADRGLRHVREKKDRGGWRRTTNRGVVRKSFGRRDKHFLLHIVVK